MENTQSFFCDATHQEEEQGDDSVTTKTKFSPSAAAPAPRSAPDHSSGVGAGASSEVVDDGGDDAAVLMLEHLFDKVLTPADMEDIANTASYDRLTLGPQRHPPGRPPEGLVFEDRAAPGKLWRFQSDWRSSEAHAVCPADGWALFAREKGLGAGDAVSFYRGSGSSRLFVDCKRRAEPTWPPVATLGADEAPAAAARRTMPRRSPAVPRRPRRGKAQRHEDEDPGATVEPPTILESMPLVPSPDPKRVRLFGIYLN